MLLQKTTILPTDDSALAEKIFKDLVENQFLAIFVALGTGPDVETMVQRASNMAAQSAFRHVVWIRNVPSLVNYLKTIEDRENLISDFNSVCAFSISPKDSICDGISNTELPPRPFRIFTAFSRAELSNV